MAEWISFEDIMLNETNHSMKDISHDITQARSLKKREWNGDFLGWRRKRWGVAFQQVQSFSSGR